MKKFLKCKITLMVLTGWLLCSLIGFWGKDTIYRNYTIDTKTTPYFVLVFEGISDGIFPWSDAKTPLWEKWEKLAKKEKKEAKADKTEGEEVAVTEMSSEESTESKIKKQARRKPKEFHTVEKSYFKDAVFIGDSRTVGLHDYGNITGATFYATVGMNVYDLWDEEFCEVNGKMVTLEEALKTQKFGKIYFQIGINEMGRGTQDGFMEAYTQSVQKMRLLQPDAIIFVQGIMKVAKEKSDTDPIFNNQNIGERNDRIKVLANKTDIFYLDMNEAVCDEDGNLCDELTFDDVHLYGSKYGIWVDYLLEHGISPE